MADLLRLATGALRLLPAEPAHRLSLSLAPLAARCERNRPDDPRLAINALGLSFPNPIGLAAGYDKDAEAADAMSAFGFGFVEVGTVTPQPQAGNPRPRLFRLARDRAVINRMGFNNAGMERARLRLRARRGKGIVGVNIGANKDSADRIEDYRICFERLAPVANYVSVNVSSPNTPGLRALQDAPELERLLETILGARRALARPVPILLKIAPDLSSQALDDVAAVALKSGIEGLIVSNTTTSRPATLRDSHAREAGGLSGAPLFQLSTNMLREARRRTGDKLILIGVGGVESGADAYVKIRAGASLVQLYTALSFEGPGLVSRIKRELLSLLERDGFAQVADAVGADAR